MRITADTDPDRLAAHVGADTERARLRSSEPRRQRLQRSARIRSGEWDLEVDLDPSAPPAAMNPTADGATELVVSAAPVAQTATEYPPREWDLLVQKALTVHEVGHLRYTDHDDFRRRLAAVDDGYRGVAAQVWNAVEDAAVEAGIRERWPNYGRMLRELRATLLTDVGPGIEDPRDGGTVFPLGHAVVCGALDASSYDSGAYRRLLDPDDDRWHFFDDDRALFDAEIREPLAELLEAALSEPNAVERNRLVFEFLEAVRPAIESASADGKAQLAASGGTAWGMPDDANVGESGPVSENTTALDDPDLETVGAGVSFAVGGEDDADEEEQPLDEDFEPAEDADDDMVERALREEIREQSSESRDSTDEQVLELSKIRDSVEAVDAELETDGIVVPTEERECDEETYEAALADAKRLARLLRNRFQKQRKRDLSRNRRRGRLDPAALHRSATGGRRLKMQRILPEENDYHCLFVLDRSGSMNGDTMPTAERAMGMLVIALETVDVAVSVLELYDKEVRLTKPFAQPARSVRDRLFHGAAQGGTPLADTLHIARERLKREHGKQFLFVVTDGTPSDPRRYMDALDRCTMPVVGVNLADDEAAGTSEFHRQVTVDPETEELRTALRQLVQEVLFE